MATYPHNSIPCFDCFKGAKHQCCTQVADFLVIHESEADAFGRENLKPMIQIVDGTEHKYTDFYTVKSRDSDRSCPHLKDGMCAIHKDRPDDCYIFPLTIGSEYIYFDLWCPGVGYLLPAFKAGEPEAVEHVKRSLEVSKKHSWYRDIYDKIHDTTKMHTECKMTIEEAEYWIKEYSYQLKDICTVVAKDFKFFIQQRINGKDNNFRIEFKFTDSNKNYFRQGLSLNDLLKFIPEEYKKDLKERLERETNEVN